MPAEDSSAPSGGRSGKGISAATRGCQEGHVLVTSYPAIRAYSDRNRMKTGDPGSGKLESVEFEMNKNKILEAPGDRLNISKRCPHAQ